MEIRQYIKESDIHQGDLVYIRHLAKPYKSGWWRKVRASSYKEGEKRGDKIVYVLELPTHKTYQDNLDDGSRLEHGTYVMKASTVKTLNVAEENHGQLSLYSRKAKESLQEPRYEILACVKGVQSVTLRNYLKINKVTLPSIEYLKEEERNIITMGFKQMIEVYEKEKKKLNPYQQLAEELI